MTRRDEIPPPESHGARTRTKPTLHEVARVTLVLVAWVTCLACVGCQTRDRDNPFDPENPATQGRPPILQAHAGDRTVELTWRIPGLDDVRAVRGLRTGNEVQDLVLFVQDGHGDGAFLDRDLVNDTTYTYHLEVRSPNGDWLPSAPEIATPGTAHPWVGDALGAGVRRLTPDGRDVAVATAGGGDILDTEPQADGSVWCADFGLGRVLHLSPSGSFIDGWEELGANTLALDRATDDVWVGSFVQQTVSTYAPTGALRYRLVDAGLVEDIEAETGSGGGVWFAARFSGVRRFQANVQIGRWDEFAWPVALARAPQGWVWVIDRSASRVSRIIVATGEVVHSPVSFVDPRDGSLGENGGFWVADPGRNGAVLLDATGRETQLLEIGPVTAVTWDPVGRRLWAVFRTERRVSTYDEGGRERSRVFVGNSPVKVEGFW